MVAVVVGARGAVAAPPAFPTATIYPAGSNPESVAIADVTGDGRNDLLATSSAGPLPGPQDFKLYVYRGNADRTLGPRAAYATHGFVAVGEQMMAIGTGDLNDDGRRDVAVATAAGIDVFVQSSGSLSPPTLVPGSQRAQYVAVADATGDGKNDIVAVVAPTQDRSTPGKLAVFARSGSTYTRTDVASRWFDALRVGDVTGDGRNDLVTIGARGGQQRPEVDVFARTGSGFERRTSIVETGYLRSAAGLEVGDVTGDGRRDVVVSVDGNQGDPGLRNYGAVIDVFAQTSTGHLAVPTLYGAYDISSPVAIGDFDGDARNDVAVLHSGWEAFGVFSQLADGTLGAEPLWGLPQNNATRYPTSGIAVGDLTGDARPDVAIADYNYGAIVLHGAPQPDTTPPDTTIVSGPTGTVTSASATFSFSSAETAAFQCKLDSNPWTYYCGSPFTFPELGEGAHVVRVRAADAAGNVDPTPATRSWTVETTRVLNDSFYSPQILTGSSGSVTGSNVRATHDTYEPYHAGNIGERSVWYRWTAPATGPVTFSTRGSSFNTLLGVYDGVFAVDLEQHAANDNVSSGDATSAATFDATAGTTYSIAVDGWRHDVPGGGPGAAGSIALQWNQRAASAATEFVKNGSFENGVTGWAAFSGGLSTATDGVVGGPGAAKIALNTTPQDFWIYAVPRPVASTVAGATYTGSAWVRSATPGRNVCVRLREWSSANALVSEKRTCLIATTGWQRIPPVSLTTATSGEQISIHVSEPVAQAGDSFEVDGVSLTTP